MLSARGRCGFSSVCRSVAWCIPGLKDSAIGVRIAVISVVSCSLERTEAERVWSSLPVCCHGCQQLTVFFTVVIRAVYAGLLLIRFLTVAECSTHASALFLLSRNQGISVAARGTLRVRPVLRTAWSRRGSDSVSRIICSRSEVTFP